MTVGNMIGGLFGKILSSLVIDVIILVVGVISLREVSSSSVTAGQ